MILEGQRKLARHPVLGTAAHDPPALRSDRGGPKRATLNCQGILDSSIRRRKRDEVVGKD